MATTASPVDNAARCGNVRRNFVVFKSQEQITVASVKTATQITTAFSGFVTDWVACDGLSKGVVYINLVTADATTLEVEVEESPDRTLVAPMEAVDPAVAGVAASAPQQTQFTVANYTPGANTAIALGLRLNYATLWFRVKVKRTAGTSAATTAKMFWTGASLP